MSFTWHVIIKLGSKEGKYICEVSNLDPGTIGKCFFFVFFDNFDRFELGQSFCHFHSQHLTTQLPSENFLRHNFITCQVKYIVKNPLFEKISFLS